LIAQFCPETDLGDILANLLGRPGKPLFG